MRGARTAPLVTALLVSASLGACGTGRVVPGAASTTGPLAGQQYVALGDSYTAAPGIGRSTVTNGCFRSEGNYPQLVAEQTGANLVDRSCSGAGTASIDGPQTTITGVTVPAQDEALGTDTALVTIGIGANDFTLYNLISTVCPTLAAQHPSGSPCTRANAASKVDLQQLLGRVRTRLVKVVRVVRSRAPHARVLLIGYPSVVPTEGTCAELPLTPGDYPFARSVITGLDRALADAATTTGATYVDTAGPTTGHDICAAEPWIAGRTAVKGEGAPWHPYAAEQREVARLVVQQLR